MKINGYGNIGYFYLSSFYTAVFLYIKGLQLVDIERSNPQKSQFVFLDTPERENLIRQYNFAERNSPKVMADIREVEMAIKALKSKLYQTERLPSEGKNE